MDAMNLEQKQREEARWRIWRARRRPADCGLGDYRVARARRHKLTITLNALRRELSYLHDRGLLEIEGEENETGTRG